MHLSRSRWPLEDNRPNKTSRLNCEFLCLCSWIRSHVFECHSIAELTFIKRIEEPWKTLMQICPVLSCLNYWFLPPGLAGVSRHSSHASCSNRWNRGDTKSFSTTWKCGYMSEPASHPAEALMGVVSGRIPLWWEALLCGVFKKYSIWCSYILGIYVSTNFLGFQLTKAVLFIILPQCFSLILSMSVTNIKVLSYLTT